MSIWTIYIDKIGKVNFMIIGYKYLITTINFDIIPAYEYKKGQS